MTDCENYRGISFLSVVVKIYSGILEDGVRRVTGGLTDDEEGALDQIFTLKQIGEEAREKKRRMYVDFIDLEVAYDRLIWKLCGEVLRMYNVGWVNFRVKYMHGS